MKPTDSELEILQLLWQHGPLSVRTINEMLNELSGNNSIGYTTTLKIMQIMYEKGILKRNTDQRSHIYEAALKENETQQNLLSEFLDATYRGSASTLVMQALGNHKASDAELQMIKNFIKDLETNTRNTSKNKK
ncbi:MAG: BlaI/MecI/CopY family transcriptional regulator [Saprospiraceae bacterium]|nr:BlaI/MecI/CopY family transcriptional regulator [Saprospiraceae bacterium]